MPDEQDTKPLTPPPPQGLPEVNLPGESLQDYEIITMAKDLGKAPQREEVKAPEKPKAQLDGVKSEREPLHAPLPPEFLSDQNESPLHFSLPYFLVGFFAVVVLGFGGFAIYWYWGSQGEAPLPSPPTAPLPGALPSFDSPLIAVNKTLPLEVKSSQTRLEFLETLKEAIAGVASQLKEGDLVRLYLYKEGKKFSFEDLSLFLGLPKTSIDHYIDSESYTLVYEQPKEGNPSFGVVTKVVSKANLESNLASFESQLLSASSTLYQDYTKKTLPDKSSETFLDSTYEEVPIRYINFGSPDLALDHALSQNLLLLAGSRQMMFTLIERAKLVSVGSTKEAEEQQ